MFAKFTLLVNLQIGSKWGAMPSPNVESFTLSNQRIRRSNVSLPERRTPLEALPAVSRRNTITDGNDTKVRKKIKAPVTPSIPEYEVTDDKSISFNVERETKGVSRYSQTT